MTIGPFLLALVALSRLGLGALIDPTWQLIIPNPHHWSHNKNDIVKLYRHEIEEICHSHAYNHIIYGNYFSIKDVNFHNNKIVLQS